MLQLMKLYAFFLNPSSFSSSTSSSSSPSSVVVEEKGEEEGREGDKGNPKSKDILMHISAEGVGKARHLREILRYGNGTRDKTALPPSLIEASSILSSCIIPLNFLKTYTTGSPKQRRTMSCFLTTRWVICKVRSGACLSSCQCLFYFRSCRDIPMYLFYCHPPHSAPLSLPLYHRCPQAGFLCASCHMHGRLVVDCPRVWLAFVQRAKSGTEDDGQAFCEEVGGNKKKQWTDTCKERWWPIIL